MRQLVIMLLLAAFIVSGCTGTSDGNGPSDETPGKTDVRLTLTGADAGMFKLLIKAADLTNYSTRVQKSPANWNIDLKDYSKSVIIWAYIDTNGNDSFDDGETRVGSRFFLTEGVLNDLSMNLVKTAAHASVLGDPSRYTNPKLISNPYESGSTSPLAVPINSGVFSVYGDSTARYGNELFISAFDDTDDDNFFDTGEKLIAEVQSNSYVAAWNPRVVIFGSSGKTNITATLTGVDTDKFKLFIQSSALTNYSPDVQPSPASWNIDMADYSAMIRVNAVIDEDEGSTPGYGERRSVVSLFELTEGATNNLSMTIAKTEVHVTIVGDLSAFAHPKLISNPDRFGSSMMFVAPITSSIITVYGDSTARFGNTLYLSAFDDIDNDNILDEEENLITTMAITDYVATWNATLTVGSK